MNCITIICAIIFDQAELSMSDKGLFGFMRKENLFTCFILYGAMSGFWGFCGYVIAMQYFSPLIVMNCLLLEPMVSQMLGVCLGIDEIPGPMT